MNSIMRIKKTCKLELEYNDEQEEERGAISVPPKCFPYTAATYQIDIPSFLWHGFDNYFDFDNYDYDYESFLTLLASCT